MGTNPTEAVKNLASESAIVHGFVPDVRPYYQKAVVVVVVPLLSGGGTRLKILEAAASGKAIISTSFGIEGLEFVPGKDLIVADSPADFAKAIICLCRDEVRRRELEKRARYVSLQYNWESIGSEVCHIVENVVLRARNPEGSLVN